MFYKNYIKRIIDILISIIGLIATLPFFIFISISLIFSNKGNIFFMQRRPGLNNKIFKVIKFRTMNNKKDLTGDLLPDKERLTKIGWIVRKFSLDEIPQLINVLKGDMSLIGPRPLLPEYLSLYTKEQIQRHNVRPGITGWAQVHGRNAALFSKRFENDIWYVKNISFTLDLKIILLTIKNIIKSDGVISGQNVMDVDDLGFNKKIN